MIKRLIINNITYKKEILLNGKIINYKNNKAVKESYNYPSLFALGDRVMLKFGENGTIKNCYIRIIFFTNGKVRYTVQIIEDINNIENSMITSLHNIDSVFVITPDDYEENILELLCFDNYS